jgi:putative inorganic carbon (HCO3(-)) transporter
MERLTFNVGRSRPGTPSILVRRDAADRSRVGTERSSAPSRAETAGRRFTGLKKRAAVMRERFDADYLWMVAFTALLFFRPQDQFRPLGLLHMSELTAIAGLGAMAVRRMSTGQTIVKITPEVIGVVALGGIIVLTIPFSIWPGGSLKVFSDIYVKIILIFALMITTLTTPKRLRQLTWIMILASGYLAARGVLDYARGVNLTEGNRLKGSVGGIFENPNDLALNLVTFLAPTLFIIILEKRPFRRLVASGVAALMLATIVATKSRGGFLGLSAMLLVVAYYTIKVKPTWIFAGILGLVLTIPMLPQAFWDRMDSITNAQADPTGSREARIRLMEQAVHVFAENPLTGIGAGQFENYEGPDAIERNRATHNVWLQVAAELGIFGLAVFAFLVFRAFRAAASSLRAIRPPRKKRSLAAFTAAARAPSRPSPRAPQAAAPTLSEEDRFILDVNGKGMTAAMVGWFVCAFFASVAFNWTFYYVLALCVAGREVALSRRPAAAAAEQPEAASVPGLAFSRAL